MNDDELYHHGKLGQRWGQRNGPPYPLNKEGKASFLARRKAERKAEKNIKKDAKTAEKAANKTAKKLSKLNKDQQKKLVDIQERKNKAEQEEAMYEVRKQKALKSGSYNDILKFKGDITNAEYQEASTRINWEQKFEQAAKGQNKSFIDYVNGLANGLGKVNTLANNAGDSWNIIANVHNSIRPDEKPWKILAIGKNAKSNDNKNDNKK